MPSVEGLENQIIRPEVVREATRRYKAAGEGDTGIRGSDLTPAEMEKFTEAAMRSPLNRIGDWVVDHILPPDRTRNSA